MDTKERKNYYSLLEKSIEIPDELVTAEGLDPDIFGTTERMQKFIEYCNTFLSSVLPLLRFASTVFRFSLKLRDAGLNDTALTPYTAQQIYDLIQMTSLSNAKYAISEMTEDSDVFNKLLTSLENKDRNGFVNVLNTTKCKYSKVNSLCWVIEKLNFDKFWEWATLEELDEEEFICSVEEMLKDLSYVLDNNSIEKEADEVRRGIGLFKRLINDEDSCEKLAADMDEAGIGVINASKEIFSAVLQETHNFDSREQKIFDTLVNRKESAEFFKKLNSMMDEEDSRNEEPFMLPENVFNMPRDKNTEEYFVRFNKRDIDREALSKIIEVLDQRQYIKSDSQKRMLVFRLTGYWRPEELTPITWNDNGRATELLYLIRYLSNDKGKYVKVKKYFTNVKWPDDMKGISSGAYIEFKRELRKISDVFKLKPCEKE